MIKAEPILATRNPYTGKIIGTLAVTIPRIILAELNTHRVFSRNAASSRAIPTKKMLERIGQHPFVPHHWGKLQKGMQASEEVDEETQERALELWRGAMGTALWYAEALARLGIHKQIVNRLVEPFAWTTVIVTSTDWKNFFAQRIDPAAEPHFQLAAQAMKDALSALRPVDRQYHLPYIRHEDTVELISDQFKLSAARCARVSYLTHDGIRDVAEDLRMHDETLLGGRPPHLSPFEHPAIARRTPGRCRNFRDWEPYRQQVEWLLGYPTVETDDDSDLYASETP